MESHGPLGILTYGLVRALCFWSFFFLFAKCQGNIYIYLTFKNEYISMSFFRRFNLILILKSGLDTVMTLYILLAFRKLVLTRQGTYSERTNCVKYNMNEQVFNLLLDCGICDWYFSHQQFDFVQNLTYSTIS